MIRVDDISKSYKTVKALKDISFSVDNGELFGIIGPDGGGKTTLMRILVSLILPDSGHALVHGLDTVKDYRKIREIIGYMPGKFSLYTDLTVMENLDFYAKVFGVSIKQNYQLIADVFDQLMPFKNRRAGHLSGGMKQKLALCCALIHKPEILFLDEPTTGVDAVSRKEFWDMIFKLRSDGMTILASTPYMDEAGRCDRVAFLQNGEIMVINSPDGMVYGFMRDVYAVKVPIHDVNRTIKALKKWDKTHLAYLFGDSIHWTPISNDFHKDVLLQYILSCGCECISIDLVPANIEDCYIHLSFERDSAYE